MNRTSLALLIAIPLFGHEVKVVSGSLQKQDSPGIDFLTSEYRAKGYRVGFFTASERRGVVASYVHGDSPLVFDAGARDSSIENGFLVGNGAWLPWTKSFAFDEPLGARVGYKFNVWSTDAFYYQRDADAVTSGRLNLQPLSYLRLSAGATKSFGLLSQTHFSGALWFESARVTAGAEILGERNYLGQLRYSSSFTIRALGFYQEELRPLTSGIFENEKGGAVQFFSDALFAQLFVTKSAVGLAKYSVGSAAVVLVQEEQNTVAGAILKTDVTGFHFRAGLTFGRDGGLQSIAGLGHGETFFMGAGHFDVQAEQPFEPAIFPSAWYSSILLQSTSFRLASRGLKAAVLVNLDAVQGFLGVTWSNTGREAGTAGFFMRISGGLTF